MFFMLTLAYLFLHTLKIRVKFKQFMNKILIDN